MCDYVENINFWEIRQRENKLQVNTDFLSNTLPVGASCWAGTASSDQG